METSAVLNHQIKLINRRNAELEGVTDVISFDDKEIRLNTTEGRLLISGKELHVGCIQLETGKVTIDGEISHITYQTAGKKQETSLLRRLFG
ncbi:MAG: YabP/YqfC family sporulation protein [Lachnospiraceae bacterium]|nr:YabP/YqfC family sporulation protein [Lachnospiraceae bacterium]